MDDFTILDTHNNHPFEIQIDDPLILDPVHLKFANLDSGAFLIPIDIEQQFTLDDDNDDELCFKTKKGIEILLYFETYSNFTIKINLLNSKSDEHDQCLSLTKGSSFVLPITRFEICQIRMNFDHFKKGLLRIEQFTFSNNFSSLLCISKLNVIIPILNSEHAFLFEDSHVISLMAWNDLKDKIKNMKRLVVDLHEQESEIKCWIIKEIKSDQIVENVLIWKNQLNQFFSRLKEREKTCKICPTNI